MEKNKHTGLYQSLVAIFILISAIIIKTAYVENKLWLAGLIITLPLLAITNYYLKHKNESD